MMMHIKFASLTMLLWVVALTGCSTCNKEEFFALVKHQEGVMANWAPGEFDLVDQKRALLKKLTSEATASGDYGSACRAIKAFDDSHRVNGV
jgi:hypothetical protein